MLYVIENNLIQSRIFVKKKLMSLSKENKPVLLWLLMTETRKLDYDNALLIMKLLYNKSDEKVLSLYTVQ